MESSRHGIPEGVISDNGLQFFRAGAVDDSTCLRLIGDSNIPGKSANPAIERPDRVNVLCILSQTYYIELVC